MYQDSKEMDISKLDPSKAYIQVSAGHRLPIMAVMTGCSRSPTSSLSTQSMNCASALQSLTSKSTSTRLCLRRPLPKVGAYTLFVCRHR